MRSSWKVTGPSQSIPSQRSDSWICSTDSATSRLVSVFSIRSRHSPPCWRAKSQLKRKVRTPPMCRKPVGLGAMRTRTDTSPIVRSVSALPRRLLRLEGLAVLGGAAALYFHLGYGWLLLVVLVLAPDRSLIGPTDFKDTHLQRV